MVDRLPEQPRKGRGAASNESGRFEALSRHRVDDGWDGAADDDILPPLRTELTPDSTKTVIARNTSPDVPFDRSINPYRGCEHGCVYCFARPSHAYLGWSPGLDFESRLTFKEDAASLLEDEIARPSYKCRTIAMGTNTDPYQPVERRLAITRRILEVLSRFDHPVALVTKSDLIVRDLDILAPMAERKLAAVGVSVTTLERDLARKLEPRAPTPEKRLAAIRRLAEAGIPVTVMAAPVIPGLNDHELERVIETAAKAGAGAANFLLLRLPGEVKELFTEWLEMHAPLKAARVLGLVRDCRGGALYQSQWGIRARGTGVYAETIAKRFHIARKRAGLAEASAAESELRTDLFKPPPQQRDQLALF